MSLTHAQEEKMRLYRRQWIAALRSGKYDQYKGLLSNESYTAFCCLGVACEVLGPALGIRRSAYNGSTAEGGYTMPVNGRQVTEVTALFDEVRESLGLSSENQGILIALNDHNASFSDIASALSAMLYHDVRAEEPELF
jgi:hypothetical protein